MKKTTAQIVRDELKRAKLAKQKDLGSLSKKVDDMSSRIDQGNDAARIIQENEQNLKDLGGLKHRLDVLDEIFVKVDKIAGEVTSYREMQELNSNKLSNHDDRIEKLEKHAGFPSPTL